MGLEYEVTFKADCHLDSSMFFFMIDRRARGGTARPSRSSLKLNKITDEPQE
jgi:hypothetical protein